MQAADKIRYTCATLYLSVVKWMKPVISVSAILWVLIRLYLVFNKYKHQVKQYLGLATPACPIVFVENIGDTFADIQWIFPSNYSLAAGNSSKDSIGNRENLGNSGNSGSSGSLGNYGNYGNSGNSGNAGNSGNFENFETMQKLNNLGHLSAFDNIYNAKSSSSSGVKTKIKIKKCFLSINDSFIELDPHTRRHQFVGLSPDTVYTVSLKWQQLILVNNLIPEVEESSKTTTIQCKPLCFKTLPSNPVDINVDLISDNLGNSHQHENTEIAKIHAETRQCLTQIEHIENNHDLELQQLTKEIADLQTKRRITEQNRGSFKSKSGYLENESKRLESIISEHKERISLRKQNQVLDEQFYLKENELKTLESVYNANLDELRSKVQTLKSKIQEFSISVDVSDIIAKLRQGNFQILHTEEALPLGTANIKLISSELQIDQIIEQEWSKALASLELQYQEAQKLHAYSSLLLHRSSTGRTSINSHTSHASLASLNSFVSISPVNSQPYTNPTNVPNMSSISNVSSVSNVPSVHSIPSLQGLTNVPSNNTNLRHMRQSSQSSSSYINQDIFRSLDGNDQGEAESNSTNSAWFPWLNSNEKPRSRRTTSLFFGSDLDNDLEVPLTENSEPEREPEPEPEREPEHEEELKKSPKKSKFVRRFSLFAKKEDKEKEKEKEKDKSDKLDSVENE
ncbi:hypothetical protein DASB73_032280 [Starmerella bacillaris]|uniref:Uncharacterized protein n=1 Tax=Starmerella bacillaris TaxID=1247836 RepID=A0AAV5RLI0_STABA|nr:hypothetical protein DASB73_032280 [Starmerella bacillaris]